MSGTLSHSELPESQDLATDDRWELVQRIVASRHFNKAPQLRDILFYICQRGLSDPAAVIKEHEIGCNVLGRKEDFNPYDDNIVRVQISHLRKKLEEYFTSEGKDEPIQIRVPRGAYVPRFEAVTPVQTPLPPEVVVPPAPSASVTASAEEPNRRSFPLVLVASFLIAAAAVAVLYLALRPRPANIAAAPVLQSGGPRDPFWARLFGDGQSISVVVSDTCLVMLQDILHADISVDQYSRRDYSEELLRKVSDPTLRTALELIAARQYTSLADTNVASKLKGIIHEFGNSRSSIRYARHLNVRDFKTDNFILIGSHRGVPWVELFEPQLNFALEEDRPTHRFYFRNRKPKPGEVVAYIPTENAGTVETYADIALLPNLGNTGTVLILSGISMEASEAAGELVAGGSFSKDLQHLLGEKALKDGYFEILIKTRTIAGASRSSQIMTYREIPPPEGD